VQVTGAAWRAATRIVASTRPGAESRGWLGIGQVLGEQMIKRSGHAVCSLHRAQGDEEHGFFGFASKPRSTVSPRLASILVASSFLVWVSKLVASVW
jgi:hypothetical protein